ncbi:MAG: hypothetical protein HC910_21740 [Spirulinaceae cyanobacterium SM2_1_0]|nr:hypothetical protein [Spirulinaceae cyanobacterium SM2_1_0]
MAIGAVMTDKGDHELITAVMADKGDHELITLVCHHIPPASILPRLATPDQRRHWLKLRALWETVGAALAAHFSGFSIADAVEAAPEITDKEILGLTIDWELDRYALLQKTWHSLCDAYDGIPPAPTPGRAFAQLLADAARYSFKECLVSFDYSPQKWIELSKGLEGLQFRRESPRGFTPQDERDAAKLRERAAKMLIEPDSDTWPTLWATALYVGSIGSRQEREMYRRVRASEARLDEACRSRARRSLAAYKWRLGEKIPVKRRKGGGRKRNSQ